GVAAYAGDARRFRRQPESHGDTIEIAGGHSDGAQSHFSLAVEPAMSISAKRWGTRMPFVSIDHQDLRKLAAGVFTAAGRRPEEAQIVADHLVEANLRGHDSHGVGLIPMYMDDRLAGHLHPNLHAKLV